MITYYITIQYYYDVYENILNVILHKLLKNITRRLDTHPFIDDKILSTIVYISHYIKG